jgi:two-component sensor histidine kinase
LVWMFLFPGNRLLLAQNNQIDSLHQVLEHTEDDSSRAEIILEIGSAYDQIDPHKSIEYAEEALGIFTDIQNDYGRGKSLNMIGYYNWLLGFFKESVDYYTEALNIFRELDLPYWIARTANNLGAVYWGLSDYNRALELYQESLAIRTELGHQRSMALTNNNIGLIYQEWQLYDEAMAYHRKALALAEETDYLFARAYSYHNLGLCYEALGAYDKALDSYKNSYQDYLEDVGEGGATSLALRSMGDIYHKRGDLDKAITYYRQALEDGRKVKNLFRMAYAQHSMGKTFAEAGRFDSARYYINASLNTSREMGYEDVTRDNYYVLSRLEEESGNLDKALDYFKIAASVNDSIFNKEKIAKFTELQIRYNMEKQNQENELLRQKNEIQSLQIRRDRIIRISLIAGSVFVLIILFLIYYQSRMLQRTNTALERQNAEILKMNEEKEDLIRRLEKENEERRRAEKRIAMLLQDKELLLKEVHHRIKNNMNTMKSLLSLQAKTIEDAKAAEVLKDAGSRIQSMGLLYDKIYRSENIRALSAREYIPHLVEEIVAVFPNCEKVQIETEIEDVTLPVDILSPLGIITTELVTNAMKYGFEEVEKGHLQLRFRRMDGKVKYEIRNNGQALPEDFSIEDSRGFGLRLVNMLVQQLDGKIHTGKGRETCFMITFPMFT